MALYVPLDVEFYHDPKLIDAGPMAELLYVRALGFAKRAEKDGFIAASQLRAISTGMAKPQALAARLVDVGAWIDTGSGWQIAGWLKRNKSVAQLREAKEAARMKSLLGNHKQHHVEKDRFDPTCELCAPRREPHGDPHSAPKGREEKPSEVKPSESEAKPSEGSFQISSTSTLDTRRAGTEDDLNRPSGIEAVVIQLGDGFRLPDEEAS